MIVAEICLHETLNNESNANNRKFKLKIKQSHNYEQYEQGKHRFIEHLDNERCEATRVEKKKITINIRAISLTRFSTS